jgi:hypothetical protein
MLKICSILVWEEHREDFEDLEVNRKADNEYKIRDKKRLVLLIVL